MKSNQKKSADKYHFFRLICAILLVLFALYCYILTIFTGLTVAYWDKGALTTYEGYCINYKEDPWAKHTVLEFDLDNGAKLKNGTNLFAAGFRDDVFKSHLDHKMVFQYTKYPELFSARKGLVSISYGNVVICDGTKMKSQYRSLFLIALVMEILTLPLILLCVYFSILKSPLLERLFRKKRKGSNHAKHKRGTC